MASRSGSMSSTSRAKSAKLTRSSYHKQHRLTDNQSLNSIRDQIHQVFKVQNSNKPYEQVIDLTSKVDSHHSKRINRMCVQYGIRPNNSQSKSISQKVDAQVIAKRFIRAKSKDKQKENERKKLKRAIYTITNRYLPAPHEEFFKLNHDTIKKMQIRAHRKTKTMGKISHPYLEIYQKSQIQALNTLIEKNRLTLQEVNDHPTLVPLEEWQIQSRQIRKIYTGVKQFRSSTLRNNLKNFSKSRMKDFSSIYIT